jgi:hypothetical protein
MEEFQGNLSKIEPQKIINKSKDNDFDNFFLVLGLIYNDLKDLLFFSNLFKKTYKEIKTDGTEPPSDHLGHYGGVQNHLNRLMIGLISEFLIFLDKNKEVVNSIPFMLFIKNLPPEIKKMWGDMLDALKDNNSDSFLSHIARIRSNVTFHYDQSLKELRTGFIKKFYDSPKNQYNKEAFYSLGDNMEKTRFYYSDGAVEEYLNMHMKTYSEKNYYNNLIDLIKKTNHTINYMITMYLNQKLKK